MAVAARLAAALVASTSFSGPVSTSTGRVTALSTASFASNGGTPSRDARRLEGSTSRPTADAAVLAANAFVSSSETPGAARRATRAGSRRRTRPRGTTRRRTRSDPDPGEVSATPNRRHRRRPVGRCFAGCLGEARRPRTPRRSFAPSRGIRIRRQRETNHARAIAIGTPRARARPGERDLDVDLDRFRGGAFAGRSPKAVDPRSVRADLARAGERERRAPGTIEPANAGSVVLPYAPPE